jgi:hypothetical protein
MTLSPSLLDWEDIRKAVMNTHLNKVMPVGRNSRHVCASIARPWPNLYLAFVFLGPSLSQQPLLADSQQYLCGRHPIADNPAGLKHWQYLITQNDWTINGEVCVTTSNEGVRDTLLAIKLISYCTQPTLQNF